MGQTSLFHHLKSSKYIGTNSAINGFLYTVFHWKSFLFCFFNSIFGLFNTVDWLSVMCQQCVGYLSANSWPTGFWQSKMGTIVYYYRFLNGFLAKAVQCVWHLHHAAMRKHFQLICSLQGQQQGRWRGHIEGFAHKYYILVTCCL